MATYDGISVQCEDQDAVVAAVARFERMRRRKCFRSIHTAIAPVDLAGHGTWTWFIRYVVVHAPELGWTEVCYSTSCWSLKRCAGFLSQELGCRAVLLGYQTTAGQTYVQIFDAGKERRFLAYSLCDENVPIHFNEGEPFDFELLFAERRQAELLGDIDEDTREALRRPEHQLMECKNFAAYLGIPAFRGWGDDYCPNVGAPLENEAESLLPSKPCRMFVSHPWWLPYWGWPVVR